MAIHSSDLENKIAELERTFHKLADRPPVPEPAQHVYVYRKPKGASTLCGLLAGSLVLWTGWSQIQFTPIATYYGAAYGITGYPSGNNPHTTEGVAAIHK